MGIARYLSKLASGLSSEGVIPAAKGGTGSTSGGAGNSPTISAISYTGDDTATLPAGGDTITLTGTNFNTGVKVVINGAQPSSVTRISSTQITFPAPAMTAGSYIVYVVNTDGSTALAVPGIQYSPNPVWSTAAGSLGSALKQVSFSSSVVATGDAPITYSIVNGALPSGLTLNSATGAITGTTPNISSSTTYNFTIRSTDAQFQDTDRIFSLSIVSSNPTPTVEYLVVAGGGGAASQGTNGGAAGGGGAGRLRTATGFSVSSGVALTVIVGAGGSGGTNTGYTEGNDSEFSTVLSYRGGRGGGALGMAGGLGGSGGGGMGYNGGGPAYGGYPVSGFGNDGGSGSYSNGENGGGGGGAGGGGGSAWSLGGGNGGAGMASSITGTSVYYAGGGGGGQPNAGKPAGTGGIGGGGDGSSVANTTAMSGTANTGGGGGGAYGGAAGGGGGSGIVVIRYADTYDPATATTGSPTVTVSGGYRVYKFTSSGSITF